MTHTVKLHRVLAAKPEKVYRAFTTPGAFSRWLPPDGFFCTVQHFEAKVAGKMHMSFTNFTTGETQGFGGEFLEMVPNQRLKYTDHFDDLNLPGEMVVTVTLKEVFCGTDMMITQENIPPQIPVEACYLGWQQSLTYLAKLVEPEIRQ